MLGYNIEFIGGRWSNSMVIINTNYAERLSQALKLIPMVTGGNICNLDFYKLRRRTPDSRTPTQICDLTNWAELKRRFEIK